MSIELAARLWTAGDREGALEAACVTWEQTTDPELCELCEQISERLTRERIRGLERELTPDRVRASLITAAQEGDRIAVHALLPWLTSLPKPKRRQRLAFLDPPDPVLLRSLAHWLRRRPDLNEVAEYLSKHRSRWLDAVHVWWNRGGTPERERYTRDGVPRGLGRRRGSWRRALEPAEQQALAALRAAFEVESSADRARADALLEAVRQQPEDDSRRALLADFLLSRDERDARGEFINLQLRATAGPLPEAARARERELVDMHGLRWLGPLLPWCTLQSARFERGFLFAIDLRASYMHAHERFGAPGDPIWATVEALNGGTWAIVRHPIMRSLRELGCDFDCARALLSGPVCEQITSLAITIDDKAWWSPDEGRPDRIEVLALAREVFDRLHTIPNVRHLRYRDGVDADPEAWQWLWQHSPANLESVRLRVDGAQELDLSRWCERLRRDRASIELRLDHGVLVYTLVPADNYWTVRVNHNVPHWRAVPSRADLALFVANTLGPSLRGGGLRRVEVASSLCEIERLRERLGRDGVDEHASEIVRS